MSSTYFSEQNKQANAVMSIEKSYMYSNWQWTMTNKLQILVPQTDALALVRNSLVGKAGLYEVWWKVRQKTWSLASGAIFIYMCR